MFSIIPANFGPAKLFKTKIPDPPVNTAVVNFPIAQPGMIYLQWAAFTFATAAPAANRRVFLQTSVPGDPSVFFVSLSLQAANITGFYGAGFWGATPAAGTQFFQIPFMEVFFSTGGVISINAELIQIGDAFSNIMFGGLYFPEFKA